MFTALFDVFYGRFLTVIWQMLLCKLIIMYSLYSNCGGHRGSDHAIRTKHIEVHTSVQFHLTLNMNYPLANQHNYGTSLFFMGKSAINDDFP